MNDMNETTVSPMNYLKIFFRRKTLLFIPAFFGLILGICASLLLPKQYVSSTVILVEEGKTDNPLFDKLAVSTNVGERMSTIRESMLGWNSLVKLVKRLKLDKDIETPQAFEQLVLSIRNKISIKLKGVNILTLSYLSKDPEMAKKVVETIADIFVSRNVELQNQNTADAIAFIQQQLKVYKGKIKSSEIAKMKDELKVLLVDSTEFHPKVKELREKIASKEEELKKENLEYTESSALSNATNNPIINEIKTALTKIDGGEADVSANKESKDEGLYKVMLIDKLDNVLARDEEVNTGVYNMLLERLETAKITQSLQSSKEGTKYTVLTPARIPFKPIKPNKILVSLGGLIAGLAIGIALVVGLEFLDKSFIDVEDATQYFGQPLLGAISKINTDESIRSVKEKEYWLYGVSIVVGIIAVMLTLAAANFLG